MRVPTLRERSIQIAPVNAPFQQIGTTSAEFGGLTAASLEKLGSGIGGLGQVFSEHAKRLEDEDARTAASEALTLYDQQVSTRMTGDTGYLTLTGKEAYEGINSTMKGLSKDRDTIRATLSPAAQSYFNAAANEKLSRSLDVATEHAATQRGLWQDQTTQALVNNAKALAAARPELIAEASTAGHQALQDLADLKRWPANDPRRQEQRAAFDSELEFNRIRHIAQTDPTAAAEQIEANKAILLPGDLKMATLWVTRKTTEATISAEVNRIRGMSAEDERREADATGRRISPAEKLQLQQAQAQTIADPEIRKGTEASLTRMARAEERQQAVKTATARTQALTRVSEEGLSPWALPPEQQEEIGNEHFQSLVDIYSNNGRIKTDWSRYYQAQRALNENPEAFAAYGLADYLPRLEKRERDTLQTMIDDWTARGDASPAFSERRNQIRMEDAVTRSVLRLDINAPEDRERAVLFLRDVDLAITRQKADLGKPLSNAQQQAVVDEVALRHLFEMK